MAQISRDSVEKVLAATDIVELISSYIPTTRSGSNFKAHCPFHHEKTPSFHITPARQRFHCFGCGKGGDAIGFIRDYENLPFLEAVTRLAQRAGIVIVEDAPDPKAERARRSRGKLLDLHREAAAFMHQLLLGDEAAEHARAYLKERGYGREMAVNWELGWMPEQGARFLGWARERQFPGKLLVDAGLASLRDENRPEAGLWVRFRNRLMFPIRNEIGDVIAFSGRQLVPDERSGKYVNSPETPLFKKSGVLFALDRAKKPILAAGEALLCEGQMDAIACHQQGIEHAIAPLGTAFTQGHARLLRRYTKQVVLCYDGDKAGIAGATRAFRELSAEGLSVRMVAMPQGDDPDSILQRDGPDELRRIIREASDFFDLLVRMAAKNGDLESAEDRSKLAAECVQLLASMGDELTLDQQINHVATLLQSSPAVLRNAVVAARKSQRRRKFQSDAREEATRDVSQEIVPAAIHRTVGYLCQLALGSAPAQHFLGEQFETIHEARHWLPGISILERILAAAPDPESHTAINAFMQSLDPGDQQALIPFTPSDDVADTGGLRAAEETMAALSAIVLHRRDAAIKSELKQPGIAGTRMMELLEEMKEISALLGGIGNRFEFDDDLAAPTRVLKPDGWRSGNWRKFP